METLYSPAAEAALSQMPERNARQLREKIAAFVANPTARTNAVKFFGPNTGRVRQGDYRAAFIIDGTTKTVLIETIGHRREIYR